LEREPRTNFRNRLGPIAKRKNPIKKKFFSFYHSSKTSPMAARKSGAKRSSAKKAFSPKLHPRTPDGKFKSVGKVRKARKSRKSSTKKSGSPRKIRKPSAYNLHLGKELKRLAAADKKAGRKIDAKGNFRKAVAAWRKSGKKSSPKKHASPKKARKSAKHMMWGAGGY
jgi:hypothetical protein